MVIDFTSGPTCFFWDDKPYEAESETHRILSSFSLKSLNELNKWDDHVNNSDDDLVVRLGMVVWDVLNNPKEKKKRLD